MKEELTARGMGTEMWTERLRELMIQGRKCTQFYRISYYDIKVRGKVNIILRNEVYMNMCLILNGFGERNKKAFEW